MNILIKSKNAILTEEIRDRFNGNNLQFYPAASSSKAISILSKQKINKAVLEINSISEIALLDHINKYYQQIEILLITNNEIDEILNIAKNGNYSVSDEPINFHTLNSFIVKRK